LAATFSYGSNECGAERTLARTGGSSYEGMGVIDAQWIQEHRLEMSKKNDWLSISVLKRSKHKNWSSKHNWLKQTQNRQVELVKAKAQAGGFRKKKTFQRSRMEINR
jgi:hypothetical protein